MALDPRTTRYLAGATVSRLAEEVSVPGLLLFGLAIGGTTTSSAALYSALTISAAVGGPLLASVLDRAARPHRVLSAAVIAYGLLIGLLSLVGASVPLVVAAALAAGAGLLGPMLSGGWSSQLGSLASGEPLRRAQSLDAATFNVAGLLGPVLASVLAFRLGATGALAVAGGIALVGGLIAASVHIRRPAPASSAGRRVTVHVIAANAIADVAQGLRTIVASGRLRAVTSGSVLSYLGFGALVVSIPVAADRVAGSSDAAGYLFATIAGAALVTMLILARLRPPVGDVALFLISTGVMGFGMVLTAATDEWWLVLVALAVVGMGDGPQLAAIIGIRTSETPEERRAMVFVTGASLKITAAAIGGLAGGVLAGVDLAAGLWFAAGMQAVAIVVAIGARGWRPTPRG